MRKSLQERGKWTHPVPAREDGEPPAQKARKWWEQPHRELDLAPPLEGSPADSPGEGPSTAGGEQGTSSPADSLPGLEDSPTAEGRNGWLYWLFCACLG